MRVQLTCPAGAFASIIGLYACSLYCWCLLRVLQNAVTHRLLLAPVMPAGQALQWLANKGPAPTELMMQWQVGCYITE
jgi:hypothetical protein